MARKKSMRSVSLDDDIVELYFEKYGKGSLSARLNSLLKNFLYIGFEDINSDIVEISKKIEKKSENLSKLRTEIQELEMVKEEIELKAERLQQEKEQQLQLREDEKYRCPICLKPTQEGSRNLIGSYFLHKSCFISASADVINRLMKKKERDGGNNERTN